MKTIGVMDIGTNSIRLSVEQVDDNRNVTRLAAHKEAIRLGEGEFGHNRITRAAMERGLLVLGKFADIARRSGASEITAVATAALREANNRAEFVERARDECHVDVKVISGLEEARLIYLGVASGVDLDSHEALFVDIGGGTTEMIVGNATEHHVLESVRAGAVRLGDVFLHGEKGPVSRKKYRTMLDYVSGTANVAFGKVKRQGFDLAFGSSGTIMNLAEITARRVGNSVSTIRNYNLTYPDLADTILMLCDLDVEQRRGVPGINPERADIIVSGAAILDAVMTNAGAASIRVSDRSLRDGLLLDYLFRDSADKDEYLSSSARQRSVLQMCRMCGYVEKHAEKVAELAGSLFDQLRSLGMHGYGAREAELLRYASMAHDVGSFISASDHHKHSYYIIRNWELLGFDDEEVEVMATAALCHRKQSPRKIRPVKLGVASLRLTEVMASILRISDALDRSQMGTVNHIIYQSQPGDKKAGLEVHASENCPLEMSWLDYKKDVFEYTFGVQLTAKLIVDPS